MRALCWFGKHDVRVETVDDPKILNPRDAIVRITSTAICGSDLHLYSAFMPTLLQGDILGHEFMGEIVEVGPEVKKLKVGDRVVVPFTIACGNCFFCKSQLWSLCDNTNPNAWIAEQMMGFTPSGLFGYTHMMGGYAGGQAEYARVPHADVGCLQIPGGIDDEKVLFLSDIFPTGYMAAENCDIKPGDVIAVFGCGPVGQFAIQSAFLFGAEKVIAIDRYPERLAMAARDGRAVTVNYEEHDNIVEVLRELSGGRGPDAVIDAVGMEATGHHMGEIYDEVKHTLKLATDRPNVMRQAIIACRKGGVVSIPGVYGGLLDKIPFGSAMNKALTIRTGQTHMMKYMRPLLERVERGEIDPSFVITHRMPLEEAPRGYDIFTRKQEGCIKIVLKPGERLAA